MAILSFSSPFLDTFFSVEVLLTSTTIDSIISDVGKTKPIVPLLFPFLVVFVFFFFLLLLSFVDFLRLILIAM